MSKNFQMHICMRFNKRYTNTWKETEKPQIILMRGIYEWLNVKSTATICKLSVCKGLLFHQTHTHPHPHPRQFSISTSLLFLPITQLIYNHFFLHFHGAYQILFRWNIFCQIGMSIVCQTKYREKFSVWEREIANNAKYTVIQRIMALEIARSKVLCHRQSLELLHIYFYKCPFNHKHLYGFQLNALIYDSAAIGQWVSDFRFFIKSTRIL